MRPRANERQGFPEAERSVCNESSPGASEGARPGDALGWDSGFQLRGKYPLLSPAPTSGCVITADT